MQRDVYIGHTSSVFNFNAGSYLGDDNSVSVKDCLLKNSIISSNVNSDKNVIQQVPQLTQTPIKTTKNTKKYIDFIEYAVKQPWYKHDEHISKAALFDEYKKHMNKDITDKMKCVLIRELVKLKFIKASDHNNRMTTFI